LDFDGSILDKARDSVAAAFDSTMNPSDQEETVAENFEGFSLKQWREQTGSVGPGAVVDSSQNHDQQQLLKDALIRHETRRFDDTIAALCDGIQQVLPLHVLRGMHWRDVSERVCGQSNVTAQALRAATAVTLQTPEQEAMWWSVVDALSDAERSLLLLFATGQRRLPLKSKLRVVARTHAAANTLPTSSTCFFQLSVPRYTTQAVMTERLLYAIRNCQAIDADGRVDARIAGLPDA
jgi:hypothetical protein